MQDNDGTQGFIDETDVEGHRAKAKDAGPEGARHLARDEGATDARQRDDVEGHRHLSKDAEPDGARARTQSFEGGDDDVEGHRATRDGGPDGIRHLAKDGAPDGARSRASFDGLDDDVEGHRMLGKDAEPDGLFRSGPTTQGEIARRGPGDNPHGDR